MVSELLSFGSLAFTGGKADKLTTRNAETNKKESRKSLPRIESSQVFLLRWMLGGIGSRCQGRRRQSCLAQDSRLRLPDAAKP
jgi:hypothetical protein